MVLFGTGAGVHLLEWRGDDPWGYNDLEVAPWAAASVTSALVRNAVHVAKVLGQRPYPQKSDRRGLNRLGDCSLHNLLCEGQELRLALIFMVR